MWPSGSIDQRLRVLDDRLAAVAVALAEALALNDLTNVVICEERRDELLDARLQLMEQIPGQRSGSA